jgi:hypothetical protein
MGNGGGRGANLSDWVTKSSKYDFSRLTFLSQIPQFDIVLYQ